MPKPSKSLILLGFLFWGIVKTFTISQKSSEYEPDFLYEFAAELRRNEIDVVVPPRKDNQPFDLIYVDGRNKTAAAGRNPEEAYTAESVL